MQKKIVLITVPFVQLSSPYPASAFLKGALSQEGFDVEQYDFSISSALKLFSKDGLSTLFAEIERQLENGTLELSEPLAAFLAKKEQYISTVEPVIAFLQGKYPQLSQKILSRTYLPEGMRFEELKNSKRKADNSEAAVHLASLYIDDLTDLCRNTVLPNFGLSCYASSIAESGDLTFADIQKFLKENDLLTAWLAESIKELNLENCQFVGISVPFPGNFCMALKAAEILKNINPQIKIVLGGGFINTGFRNIKEQKLFDYVDFIVLDDGELPLMRLSDYLDGKCDVTSLVRTFYYGDNQICYSGNDTQNYEKPFVPDYTGLPLDSYFTLRESTNPMHSLWSQRIYLKLRMAHGCYHHKCTFCDTYLDYIATYKAEDGVFLVDSVEKLIKQTGIRTFHFVDEAMPPAVLKTFCLEIIKRNLDIIWWGNIRFDKVFDSDLPQLMSRAGCIAVTGGMESGCNRVLELMNKMTTVENIVRVSHKFAKANILVHGYLIYGFPDEKPEEIAQTLEVVRQMFQEKILHSVFFHRFSLTIHSELFRNPERYNITGIRRNNDKLTDYDIYCKETIPVAKLDKIGEALNVAVYNFNLRNSLDMPASQWLHLPCKVKPQFVKTILNRRKKYDLDKKCCWLGTKPIFLDGILYFAGKNGDISYELPQNLAEWICKLLEESSVGSAKDFLNSKKLYRTLKCWLDSLPDGLFENKEDFLDNELWNDLEESGLILL
jgi:radical SAM superfamily enzyme YgiQ (UPF0313 family)